MASIGGKRIAKEHVVAAYRKNNMRAERGSTGFWRGGSGCGCGLAAVAASSATFVKTSVVEGQPMFHDWKLVIDTMKREHGASYINGFMHGFDGDSSRAENVDEEGNEDGAAAYEACVAAGLVVGVEAKAAVAERAEEFAE